MGFPSRQSELSTSKGPYDWPLHHGTVSRIWSGGYKSITVRRTRPASGSIPVRLSRGSYDRGLRRYPADVRLVGPRTHVRAECGVRLISVRSPHESLRTLDTRARPDLARRPSPLPSHQCTRISPPSTCDGLPQPRFRRASRRGSCGNRITPPLCQVLTATHPWCHHTGHTPFRRVQRLSYENLQGIRHFPRRTPNSIRRVCQMGSTRRWYRTVRSRLPLLLRSSCRCACPRSGHIHRRTSAVTVDRRTTFRTLCTACLVGLRRVPECDAFGLPVRYRVPCHTSGTPSKNTYAVISDKSTKRNAVFHV